MTHPGQSIWAFIGGCPSFHPFDRVVAAGREEARALMAEAR